MKRGKLTGLAAFALAMAAYGFSLEIALAESPRLRGVVELFTSQGCRSCPPADEVLGELAARGDVVALAYHVDYWDYLGWKDTLASPDNTQRQRDYGRTFGIRSVYTPQAVINGQAHVNGAKRDAITSTLDQLAKAGKGMSVELKAKEVGESIVIETGPGPTHSKAHLVLVFFEDVKPVQIERGENTGNTIVYWNAVTGVQTAGMWKGQPTRFELPMSEINKKGGCAALLQSVSKDGLPGPILGAVVLRSPEVAWTK